MHFGPLADLIDKEILPEPSKPSPPAWHSVDAPMPATGTPPAVFEADVFNFLLNHKEPLGIRELWRCKNVRIDGLLALDDGRRVALEVKYKMDWEKACQACAQVAWYRKSLMTEDKSLDSGLVVFNEFARDWARTKKSSLVEIGWSNWYAEHREAEGVRMDLVRLRDGVFESFPTALAAAQHE
jgi:hypothetical protein